jgi:VWFA-related protein
MQTSHSSKVCRFVVWPSLFLAVLGAALRGSQAGPPPQAQPDRQMPPVTFRVEINYVEVDAIVLDRRGEFVADLQQADFQVLEDGKPEAIKSFGLVRIPLERPEAPLFVKQPIEPDVQSNIRPFDGRVYLIFLDGFHTSAQYTPWVRAAAKKFIEASVGANDVAAVVSTQSIASQDFTNSKRLLLAAVDKFIGNSLESATVNRINEYNLRRQQAGGIQGPLFDPEEAHRAYNASATLDAIHRLCDFMSGVRGRRKAMVLFSEGIGYDITNIFANPNASQVLLDTKAAIAAATQANVNVYAVDPRGLTALAGMDAASPSPPMDADPALKLGPSGMQEEVRRQNDSLRVISEETGGFASINSNDFAAAFDRIQHDNSSYYVLGYYPANERRDGRFRKIEVKVNRPGVEIRYRKGYVAPSGKPAADRPIAPTDGTPPILRDLLSSPMPIPGLRLTATAAPFKGTGKTAAVRIVVQADGRDLTFTKKGGKLESALDLAVVAVDGQSGKDKGGLHFSLALPVTAASQEQVIATGIRVTAQVDLPPGIYQLRIGAADTVSQRVGSVHYDLAVPDFSAGPLTMSGIMLSSTLAAQTRTAVANPDELIRKALPGPPTVSREFHVGEELALVAEVYDNDAKTPHTVDITTSLRSDDGRVVYSHEDQRSSGELGGSIGGYGHQARVPLKGMAPGLYVLKVEARTRLGKGAIAFREVQFRVVP